MEFFKELFLRFHIFKIPTSEISPGTLLKIPPSVGWLQKHVLFHFGKLVPSKISPGVFLKIPPKVSSPVSPGIPSRIPFSSTINNGFFGDFNRNSL